MLQRPQSPGGLFGSMTGTKVAVESTSGGGFVQRLRRDITFQLKVLRHIKLYNALIMSSRPN